MVSAMSLVNSTNDEKNETDLEFLYEPHITVLILLYFLYGTISIAAVIGNFLVIYIVVTAKRMRTVTNFFIANLALADVTIGLFAIPFQFQAALLQRWTLPDFMCPFCPFVQITSVNVSVLTLTAIAVDRHRAILNPLKPRLSKQVSAVAIGAIWLVSLLFAAPIAYSMRVFLIEERLSRTERATKYFCDNLNLEFHEMLIYRYSLVFMQYIIPLSVISFVYIQMAIRLWGSKTPGNAQDARDLNMLKNKKRVIKMLVIVVAMFGICWLPLQTFNFIMVTWPKIATFPYINVVFFVSDWLAMSNSCVNPFIYSIYNEKFKREFRKRRQNISSFTRSSVRSTYFTSSTRKTNTTAAFPSCDYPPSQLMMPLKKCHEKDNHHHIQLVDLCPPYNNSARPTTRTFGDDNMQIIHHHSQAIASPLLKYDMSNSPEPSPPSPPPLSLYPAETYATDGDDNEWNDRRHTGDDDNDNASWRQKQECSELGSMSIINAITAKLIRAPSIEKRTNDIGLVGEEEEEEAKQATEMGAGLPIALREKDGGADDDDDDENNGNRTSFEDIDAI